MLRNGYCIRPKPTLLAPRDACAKASSDELRSSTSWSSASTRPRRLDGDHPHNAELIAFRLSAWPPVNCLQGGVAFDRVCQGPESAGLGAFQVVVGPDEPREWSAGQRFVGQNE